jgi:hypothetical protein
MRVPTCVVLASILILAATAHADGKFHAVPGGKAGLQLRVVKYDGEVNGELTVEIRNPSSRVASFTARGLYFVPDGDPDAAPQRLGAVGPMQIGSDREDEIRVPAGGKVVVKLDVFCVDDHRSAPTSETPFTLARHRMPAALTRTIDHEARAAAKSAGGFGNAGALAPVQSEVWKARDEKWVELDGEGAQETDKASGHDGHDRHDRRDGRIEEQAPLEELQP